MGGSAFNTPLHGGDPFASLQRSNIDMALYLQGQTKARQDMALRQQLAGSLIAERQEKIAADRTKQAQALYAQGVEDVSGLKPGEQAEAAPFFSQYRQTVQPGAYRQPSTGTLPSGNLVQLPFTGEEARQTALRQGEARLRAATEASGAALPPDAQSEYVRGQIARGEIRVPSAVPGAREKAIKTEMDAQILRQRTAEESSIIEEKRQAAVAKGQEVEKNRIALIYQVPMAEAELAGKKATAAHAGAQTREIEGKLGERPLIPGSPAAVKAAEDKADLENKQLSAQKAQLDLRDHRLYVAARDRYAATGKVEDLNAAILAGTGGAVNLANLALRGEEQDLNRNKFIASELDKTMEKKLALQEHINKKGDIGTAEGISRQINQSALAMATIGKSPTVSWESVRQEEGMFGRIVRGTVTMKREEALALSNDMVHPDTPEGLALLMKSKYGDLINRAAAHDQTAVEKLIQAADTYPGVTHEAAAAVTEMLRSRSGIGQAPPGGVQAPQVPEAGVPKEFQEIERQDAIRAAEAEVQQKRGNVFTKWLAVEAQKMGKLPTQLSDAEIAALRKRFDSTLAVPQAAR